MVHRMMLQPAEPPGQGRWYVWNLLTFLLSSDSVCRLGVGVPLPLRDLGFRDGADTGCGGVVEGCLGVSHMNSVKEWPAHVSRWWEAPLQVWGHVPDPPAFFPCRATCLQVTVSACGLGLGMGSGDSESLVLTRRVHTHHLQHCEEGEREAREHGVAAVETWQEWERGGCCRQAAV